MASQQCSTTPIPDTAMRSYDHAAVDTDNVEILYPLQEQKEASRKLTMS